MSDMKIVDVEELETEWRAFVLRRESMGDFDPQKPGASFLEIYGLFRQKTGRFGSKSSREEVRWFRGIFCRALAATGKDMSSLRDEEEKEPSRNRKKPWTTYVAASQPKEHEEVS